MFSGEERFFNTTFNEREGQIAEKAYLGTINDKSYVENFTQKLEEALIAGSNEFKDKNDPIGFLLELKESHPEMYQELREQNLETIEAFVKNRIKENRFRAVNEVKLRDQFNIIEKSQGKDYDPSDPKTDFANDLHATIVEELGCEYEDVQYYSAIGTHLDYQGVDAFFKIKYIDWAGKKRKMRVTFDFTTASVEAKKQQQKDKKESGAKGLNDMVIYAENDRYNRKRNEDIMLVKESAKQIINIYKRKVEERDEKERKKNKPGE